MNNPESHELGQVLNNYGDHIDFLGKDLEVGTAQKIANCLIDPSTHLPFEDEIKRRKLKTTQVFFKKNTRNKIQPLNQKLTKFFKKPEMGEIELGDVELDCKSPVKKVGFCFKKSS